MLQLLPVGHAHNPEDSSITVLLVVSQNVLTHHPKLAPPFEQWGHGFARDILSGACQLDITTLVNELSAKRQQELARWYQSEKDIA